MSAPLDLGAELLTHLRGQGFDSAAALLALAIDSAHEEYRRAVCATVEREVWRTYEVQLHLADTLARAKRPRLARNARRAAITHLHLASLVTAVERDDRGLAADALAGMAAA